jgi:outer membrane receptor protein involved in Fe transport
VENLTDLAAKNAYLSTQKKTYSQKLMRRFKLHFKSGVLFAALFVMAQQARPQEKDSASAKLEDMLNVYLNQESLSNVDVSSASRFEQSAKQAPATVITITSEQIQRRGYQSLHDVLRDLPDIKTETFAEPGTLDMIAIRGVRGQQRFLILLDGFRISSPTNDPVGVMENYPVHLAKRIEVLYGPASALYGADAVTGIINIISKRSYDIGGNLALSAMGGTAGRFDGNFLYGARIGEAANLVVGGHYTYDRQPDLSKLYPDDFIGIVSLQTGVFNTNFGPARADVKPQFEYPYQAGAGYLSVGFDAFRFSLFHNFKVAPSSATYTPKNTVYNAEQIYRYRITTFNAGYSREFQTVYTQTLLTASRYELDPSSYFQNLFNGVQRGYKYGYGSMLRAEQLLSFYLSDNLSLTGGAVLEYFSATPKGPDLQNPVDLSQSVSGTLLGTASPIFPDGIPAALYTLEYYNAGGFVQTQYAPTEQLSFTLGIRYDFNSRFEGVWNPRFGAVFRPNKSWTIKALYGSAYLAPAPFDAYENFGSFAYDSTNNTYASSFWRLPNPDLKPIRSQNVELGIRGQLTDNLSLSMTGYYTKLTGLFRPVDDSTNGNRYGRRFLGYSVAYIETLINQGEQDNYGFSVQLDHLALLKNARIESYASLSYVDGRVDDAGGQGRVEIGGISPIMIKAGTQITWKNLDVAANFVYVGTQRTLTLKDNSAERVKIADYPLLNLFGSYRLNDRFCLVARVLNALDARYRTVNREAGKVGTPEFERGTPQNPIRVILGFRVKL